jgi:hypothetical protein
MTSNVEQRIDFAAGDRAGKVLALDFVSSARWWRD